MPIDRAAWVNHQSRAAELLAQRAAAWPERPPELVASSREHLSALAKLIIEEVERTPDPTELPDAPDLLDVDNALFICGTMKSGTSLILEMFDDHPSLIAMPGDTSLRRELERPETRSTTAILDHWVQRVMNPTGLPPYFPLGPHAAPYERYVRVVRRAWNHITSHHITSHHITSHHSRVQRGSPMPTTKCTELQHRHGVVLSKGHRTTSTQSI